jgi:glycosyltransferase involved in cell wall biosynthesis
MRTRKLHITLLSLPENFHCRKWAQALAQAGAEVSVVSFHKGNIPGVTCYHIPAPIRTQGRYRYPSFLLTVNALRRKLEAIGTDVLHPLHVTPFGSWGHWSGFRPIIPAAIGADILEYAPSESAAGRAPAQWKEVDSSSLGLDKLLQPLKRRYFQSQVRRALHAADAITADNQTLINTMQEVFGIERSKIHLIRWGIDPERFSISPGRQSIILERYGLPLDRPFLLLPRGLKQLYQTDLQLEALEEVQPQIEEAGLATVCLGAGYDANPTILRQAQHLQHSYPHFYLITRRLEAYEMAALWLNTKLFISAPMLDGYSSALAEGRYAGAIPLVNDIPAHRELLQHQNNAWVVRPFTPEALIQSLKQLLENLAYWQQTFAKPNKAWIESNGLLHPNAEVFLALAEALATGKSL